MKNDLNKQFYNVLQNKFGFSEFRPGQLETLTALMTQNRILCIKPTGYGKSLLYQLPAVILEGMTLVISPLLALMRDQLSQLKNRFNIAAASINSDQILEDNNKAKKDALQGKVRILFISPEQLDNLDCFTFLMKLPISLVVVDEAHCISMWGHDFRPSYRQIIKLIHELIKHNSNLKILGLTATANHTTEDDIKKQLTVNKYPVIVHRESMNRNNIRLSVLHCKGTGSKLATLHELLNTLQGPGLIYCASRENTETVASFLREQEFNAVAYHAGIEPNKKRLIQEDFLSDKYSVIAATNALGMGIDKPNLRFIVHFDFPGSITAYYQEVGRSGRDGLAAEGILLYDSADNRIQMYFIEAAQPSKNDFKLVLEIIRNAKTILNLPTLKRLTGLHPNKLQVILAELQEQLFVTKTMHNRTQIYQLLLKKGQPKLDRYTSQYKTKITELDAMRTYAEQSKDCLMYILCKALGDIKPKKCNQCNICTKSIFKPQNDNNIIFPIASWLERRTVTINLSRNTLQSLPGVAILDGKLRSNDFINFMRERAMSSVIHLGLSDNLLQLIKDCLAQLKEHHALSCIIPLPTRTWGARDAVITILGNYLKLPVLYDVLTWQEVPLARQGELLNNEQRLHNVTQRMNVKIDKKIKDGAILLFDDYVGSGATLEEAIRALREKSELHNKIIPFTIAAVKWRIGKKGMI